MNEVLFVDGYNILNDWAELVSMQRISLSSARDALIDTLMDYQGFTGKHVILVFDAHMVKNAVEKSEFHGAVEVVYTRADETADNCIERRIFEWMRRDEDARIRVATSDQTEQHMILGLGAARMSARELKGEVDRMRAERDRMIEARRAPKPNTLEGRLAGDTLDKLERLRRRGGQA